MTLYTHTHTHTHTHTRNLKNKGIILLIVLVITIATLWILAGIIIQLSETKQIREKLATDNIEFSYEKRQIAPDKMQLLIIVKDEENGLSKVEYPEGDILNCNGKFQVAIDYVIENKVEYKFKITSNNGEEKEVLIYEENMEIFSELEKNGKTVDDLNEYGITISRSGYDQYGGYNELHSLGMGSGTNINRNTFVLTIDYEILVSKLGNMQFKGIYGHFFQSVWTYDSWYTSWIYSKIVVTYDDGTIYETPNHQISACRTTREEEHFETVIFDENKKVKKIEMIIDMYDDHYGNAQGCIKNIGLLIK